MERGIKMALFDEIGKKISLAGKNAVDKGKAFADATKLNAAISEEEKKVNNAYYQIGNLYVALHPDDYEDDFSTLINAIVSSQEKIASLKQQIQNIKGVTRCEQCGAEVPNNIAYCSACGAQMPKKEVSIDEAHIKCDNCGAVVDKNLRFCTSCGKPLVKPEQQTNVSAGEQTQPASVPRKCPACGAAANDAVAFCVECGTPLN